MPNPPETETPRPAFWRSPVVLGVAAGAAVLVIGGAGAAIALGIAGSDSPAASAPTESASPSATPEITPTATFPAPSPTPEHAAADPASLQAAIAQAVEAVGGIGVTEIEVRRGGWHAEVRRADGSEVDVVVGLDGSTRVDDNDDDDGDDPLIDPAQLPELVRISLEAAGGGVIEQISADDDDHAYDVEVRLADGTDVEVELDAALRVVDVDRD